MTQITSLGIPSRTSKILEEHGIRTIEDLTGFCRRELGDLRGIGQKSLDIVEQALAQMGLSLAEDPWGPYVCARHGQARGDTNLESLFLCDECADKFQESAFRGTAPEYVGPPVKGYCLHCNRYLEDIRLRQWFLCGVCDRVVRSIGRSIVADQYVLAWWKHNAKPILQELDLVLTDPPELQPRDREQIEAKIPRVDFTCIDTRSDHVVFGIELKTGRSHISGSSIGSRMGQFQLDNSDCDDILDVVRRDRHPVYLIHAQVIDRADPPTVYYAPVGLWWTDLFSMREHFQGSRRRPRETRIAAYYDVSMFQEMDAFIAHLRDDEPARLRARIESEGVPELYW